ncbi:MAG TPA: DUF4129 domain-containing protein [Actinomycetes bacterium]|nr:DUF4129 domain-containing protein [Actinomycetes bacterium]
MAEDRRRRRRGLLPVALAVGLLALVAAGSLRGPLGSGRGRPSYPADLIDSLLLLVFLAMVAAGVLAVVSLWPGLRLDSQRRRRGSSFGLILPMAAVLVLWLLRDLLGLGEGGPDDPPPSTLPAPSTLEVPDPPPQSGVVPWIVAGVALAAMVTVVAAQLAADRRRRRPPKTPAERLVDLLDDTLEDLESERDPRRAVIAAWARMEHGLAAAGLPRHPAEAPFEYAGRVLEAALVPTDRGTPSGFPGRRGSASPTGWAFAGFPGPLRPGSVHRLTGLFERAKFSQHRIGEGDREQAIAALRAVRRDLAEAVERAAEAQAEAAAEGEGEPVAGGGGGRR